MRSITAIIDAVARPIRQLLLYFFGASPRCTALSTNSSGRSVRIFRGFGPRRLHFFTGQGFYPAESTVKWIHHACQKPLYAARNPFSSIFDRLLASGSFFKLLPALHASMDAVLRAAIYTPFTESGHRAFLSRGV